MDETTKPLTAKQKRFCDEYMIDMNGKQAAIRAGYSEHTAEQQGSRLLSKAKVFAGIQRLIDERAERVEVDADYVVTELRKVVEDDSTPAAARVTALTVLARHLGMLTDKVETKEMGPAVKVIYLPAPGFEDYVRDDSKPTLPQAVDKALPQ